MALLEARKKQLAAEGLFDETRKKPLPYLPETIGVVTSPSGAVIRDILHRLSDRFPRHVLVWPVRVQGEACAEEVARAIAGFNALTPGGDIPRPDVLIVARGGGSLEDLWGFNEEIVARTAAQSDIPLISAVGHETDTTLIDFVADRRAPTPTAAAEMAVPVRADLQANLAEWQGRLLRAQDRYMQREREFLTGLARGLPKLEDMLALPAQKLDTMGQRLGGALQANSAAHQARFSRLAVRLAPTALQGQINLQSERLAGFVQRAQSGTRRRLERLSARLDAAARQLRLLSHESVLERGFALVLDASGKPLRQAAQVAAGDALDIHLANEGRVAARVEGGAEPAKKPTRKNPAKPSGDDGQGQLL
jgi:exodeoxyribonuclease VII large subunit